MSEQEKKNTTTFTFTDGGKGGSFEPASVSADINRTFSFTYHPPVSEEGLSLPGKEITVMLKPTEDFKSCIEETNLAEKAARANQPDFQFMQNNDEPEFFTSFGVVGFDYGAVEASTHDWAKGEGGIRQPDYSPYNSVSKNIQYHNADVGLPGELTSTGIRETLMKWEFNYFPPNPNKSSHNSMKSYDPEKNPFVDHPMALALQLIHPELEGIDPNDDTLSEEIKEMIVDESIRNPVYFAQVVCGMKGENRYWVIKAMQEKKKELSESPILIVDLPIKRQSQDLEREVVTASSVDWTDWNVEHELFIGDDVKDLAQKILDTMPTVLGNSTIPSFLTVNYSKSFRKGKEFLHHFRDNVERNEKYCDVSFDLPLNYDEYAEIMLAYMEDVHIVKAPTLHAMMAQLLLDYKGQNFLTSPYATAVVEPSFFTRFIDENKEKMANWAHFIDSTQVLALASIPLLRNHYEPEKYFDHVEVSNYVGANIAKLYAVPEFILYYFGIQGAEYKLSYFKPHFEEPLFDGKMLVNYFRSRNNYAALMFEKLAEGAFKASDVGIGIFSIGVFAPDTPFEEYDATK